MFLANTDSSDAIKTEYDGALGLKPYSADDKYKSYNFVYQLK